MLDKASPHRSPLSRTQNAGFFTTHNMSSKHSPLRASQHGMGDGKAMASFKIINRGRMPNKGPKQLTRLDFLM